LEDFDFEYFLKLGKKYKLRKSLKLLRELLEKTREVEELNLNKHAFAKKKKEVLKKLGVFR